VPSSLAAKVGAKSDEQAKIAEQGIIDTIAVAEDVHDPLNGLVEQTAADSGAPFTPEVVAALAALKKKTARHSRRCVLG
jgi:hypothetical protein